MITFLKSLTPLGRVIAVLLVLALIAAALIMVRSWFVGDMEVKTNLGTEQADAAVASGQDAVTTVAGQADTEAERAQSVDEMKEEVDEADNAADAHDAGAGWLCVELGICSEE